MGWVSIGVGLAAVAAPVTVMNVFGIGERPKLGRFLGVRDLVLGAGLLRAEDKAAWVRARGVADALDAALILGGAALGAFPRSRAPLGLTTATSFAALCFLLARRLDR